MYKIILTFTKLNLSVEAWHRCRLPSLARCNVTAAWVRGNLGRSVYPALTAATCVSAAGNPDIRWRLIISPFIVRSARQISYQPTTR